MARILYETLLLSCVAAFAIGVVIAAASVFGEAGAWRRGQSAPRPAHGGARPGGAHSPFLLVVARGVPGVVGGWAGHTLAQR